MLTALDQIANQNHLQMIKAAVPYLNAREQRMIAVYTKLLELQNVLDFYCGDSRNVSACSVGPETVSIPEMLSDIKNYCDPSEQEMIDQCLQMLSAFELYSALTQPDE